VTVFVENGQSLTPIRNLPKKESNSKYINTIYSIAQTYDEIFSNKVSDVTINRAFESLEDSKSIGDVNLEKLSLLVIMELYKLDLEITNREYTSYLEQYKSLIEDQYDNVFYALNNYFFESRNNNREELTEYVATLDRAFDRIPEDSKLRPFYYFEKATFSVLYQQVEAAKSELQKTIELSENTPMYRYINYGAYLKLSELYYKEGDLTTAFVYLNKTKQYNDLSNPLKSDYYYYRYGARYYEKLKENDSAYFFLKKSIQLRNKIQGAKEQLRRSFANVKYKTVEKEKENLELKQKNLEKRNWIIVIVAIVIFGIYISFQSLKNSKKKRLLALQEKELEQQKNLTLLKEQEISTINAMVEGQEKERKRVAEDLHDNLGSVIATLKLHFENLRMNREKKKINQEALFDKTENLIDEAYQKVRSIAHAKNSGVIANQGLLVAVKLMAEKISSANKVQIEVIDYGLEKPIENSLEIALFRIIQELTTNIIKHSEATRATLNISQDPEDITILIEDNGKGMDTSQISLKKGMGLHSIKTRIEHLEGSFTIDSTLTKGTTIIINIPT
jgi:signal transduction histidine kinase